MGALIVHLVVYAAVGVFLLAVAVRFFKIIRMPLHLRWELYPVAHEAGARVKYGGSQLEELNWWTKKQEKSRFNELKAMVPEMVFMVALFEHNRKLWWRSFPFHFGLYILAGFIGLLVLGAVMELPQVRLGLTGGVGLVVYYLTHAAFIAGMGLTTLGALMLLERRLFDPELKAYSSFGHIFNLIFFLAVFAVAWLTYLIADPTFSLTRNFIVSLLPLPSAFNLTAEVGHPLLALEIVLAVLLVAYIPLTHMSHFFIKWFTYHKVRWEDEPNFRGGEIEKKVIEQVQYPVTWSASHLNADGKKNWVDIATEEMK